MTTNSNLSSTNTSHFCLASWPFRHFISKIIIIKPRNTSYTPWPRCCPLTGGDPNHRCCPRWFRGRRLRDPASHLRYTPPPRRAYRLHSQLLLSPSPLATETLRDVPEERPEHCGTQHVISIVTGTFWSSSHKCRTIPPKYKRRIRRMHDVKSMHSRASWITSYSTELKAFWISWLTTTA